MVCTLTPAKNRLALSGFLQVPHLQEVFVAVAGLFLSFLKITVPWLCQDPLPLPFPGKLLINIPGSDGPTKASVVFSHVTPASLLQSLEHREWAAHGPSHLTFRSKACRLMVQAGQTGKQTRRAGFWDTLCSTAKQTAGPPSILDSFCLLGIKITLYKW